MTKKEARIKYRKLRNSLSDEEVKLKSELICQKLMKLELDQKTVHLFFPIQKFKEVDLGKFYKHCVANKIKCCTSVSDFQTSEMKTVEVNTETVFQENDWGIPEPVNGNFLKNNEIDIVIIPLLYADKQGNRVGYGKGFYDRFLSNCNADTQKIGVNYFPSEEEIEDVSKNDIQINQLVIPE